MMNSTFKNAGGGVAAGVVSGLAYSVFRGLPTGRFVGLFGSGPLSHSFNIDSSLL